jgi:Fe-S oxidoreductase
MEQEKRDLIRFCALCPNPCRILYPAGVLPKESSTNSALAYLAHALLEGFVAFSPEVDRQLSTIEGAQICKTACPYGIDTANLVTEVRRGFSNSKRGDSHAPEP